MIEERIIALTELSHTLYGESDEKLEDFSIEILFKYAFSENDIYTLHHENGSAESRIGWLFPLSSIYSKEHCLAESVHYQDYARIASLYLERNRGKLSSIFKSVEYVENAHFLILYNDYAKKNQISSPDDLILPLSFFGYYKKYSEDRSLYINDCGLTELKELSTNKLIINKNESISYRYIHQIYTDILPFEASPYYRFMLLYQIVENEMEKLFYKKIDEYKLANYSIGSIRNEITKLSNESKLITILFCEIYKKESVSDSIMADIRDLFLHFKSQEEIDKLTTFSDVLYAFRNLLVHSYYKCQIHDDRLKHIVDYFEIGIISTLQNKKKIA